MIFSAWHRDISELILEGVMYIVFWFTLYHTFVLINSFVDRIIMWNWVMVYPECLKLLRNYITSKRKSIPLNGYGFKSTVRDCPCPLKEILRLDAEQRLPSG